MLERTRPWLKAAIPLVDEQAKQCREIFHRAQLRALLNQYNQRQPPQLRLTESTFIEGLQDGGVLRVAKIAPDKKDSPYKAFVRYVRGKVNAFDIALSLRPGSYLSHGTAARLHGILSSPTNDLFVNKEQSSKPHMESELDQTAIHNAFSGHPRETNFVYRFQSQRIFLLGGKNTGNFDVVEKKDESGSPLLCTGLERTLVDMTVRPVYSGGASEVRKAFHAAREQLSIRKLVDVLAALGHKYPYHQAVGFYLQQAGFSEKHLAPLRALGLNFDFYLANGPTVAFDDRWRVHVPAGLAD